MQIYDKQVKKKVHVSGPDCLTKKCYWPRPDPGTFVQGRGYRHRSNDWLCGTREIHGCPIKKDTED